MVISTVSVKGGSGKTTVAINLSVYLALKGYSVMIIDTDKNKNLSTWHQIRTEQQPEAVKVDYCLAENEQALNTAYNAALENYDFIIFDGRPEISRIMSICMSVADLAIQPIEPSLLDMWTNELVYIDVFEKVKKANKDLKGFFVLNKCKLGTRLFNQCKIELKGKQPFCGIDLAENSLSDLMEFKEVVGYGLGVLEGKNVNAKGQVVLLFEEILKGYNI